MSQGPSLIFDKSSLESLNLDEAVLMDNFYMSNITPLFFVEVLADLEKNIRSKSTPEQLVGSLADRTPDFQSYPNAHHMAILASELGGTFDLTQVLERVAISHGIPVQLGDRQGVVFKQSKEQEAVDRWAKREFLDVERHIAKEWRRSLTAIDFEAMVRNVMDHLGYWRKPKDLSDAKQIADAVIDYIDPEWLVRFGLTLIGMPDAAEPVIAEWIKSRRPNLRRRFPYFVFMLTINVFFCLVLPTQLLKNVKASHHIDLAYLYYLPFCSVFTSKDNFHVQIVPLFLNSRQTFVHGSEFKQEMQKLVAHYSAFPQDVIRTGLANFGAFPPDDQSFLTTRLWDIYMPGWREIRDAPKPDPDPMADKKLVAELEKMTQLPDAKSDHFAEIDQLDYVKAERQIYPRKGKWQRFSDEQEQR
jgi:hypothetical protein